MRLGAKARTGLILSLGVLAGLGFISLPGIINNSTHSQSLATTKWSNTNSTSGTSATATDVILPSMAQRVNQTGSSQPRAPAETSLGTLSGIVALLIAPALGISLFVSFVVRRRPRKSGSGFDFVGP